MLVLQRGFVDSKGLMVVQAGLTSLGASPETPVKIGLSRAWQKAFG